MEISLSNKEEHLLVDIVYRTPNCMANNDENLLQLFELLQLYESSTRMRITYVSP